MNKTYGILKTMNSNNLYCDENTNIINPINLNFYDLNLEEKFVTQFNNDNIFISRVGIFLTFCLFSIYAIGDIYIFPVAYMDAWAIRIVEDIVLIVFFIYSFNPKYKLHLQRNNIISLIYTGLSIMALFTLQVESEYFYIFISAYTLLITGAFLIMGLLFFNALKIVLSFHILIALIMYMQFNHESIFLYAILFLSISLLVIIASYFWELSRRKLYVSSLCADELLFELKNTYKELEEQANVDYLTKLYNRRYFHIASKELIKIAKREKKSISAIMIDIDKFKSINDRYGHQVGDDVIIFLSSLLTSNTRDSDIVARYGGEEFVVLLPNTSKDGASIIAEQLRLTTEESQIQISERITLNFTISLGISYLDIDNE